MATYFRIFVAFAFIPTTAFGFTIPCPATGIRSQVQLLQKISVMGEENRMVFAEYAKLKGLTLDEVYKLFSGLGILQCGGLYGTAQLTKSKSVITTAGHAFFSSKCNKYPMDIPCKFKMVTPPYEETTLKMDTIVASCIPNSSQEDWAVARLEKAMPGEPFEIPEDDHYYLAEDNTKVTQISAHAFNFKKGSKHPPTVQECLLTEAAPRLGVGIQTDCDNGGWSSGSAMLVGDPGSFTMAAMVVAEPKDAKEFLPFNRENNFNYAVPVAGKFRETILKMADQ